MMPIFGHFFWPFHGTYEVFKGTFFKSCSPIWPAVQGLPSHNTFYRVNGAKKIASVCVCTIPRIRWRWRREAESEWSEGGR